MDIQGAPPSRRPKWASSKWSSPTAIARAGHAVTARAASGQHCDAPEWSGDDIELWGAGDPEGLANAAGSVQYAYEAAAKPTTRGDARGGPSFADRKDSLWRSRSVPLSRPAPLVSWHSPAPL